MGVSERGQPAASPCVASRTRIFNAGLPTPSPAGGPPADHVQGPPAPGPQTHQPPDLPRQGRSQRTPRFARLRPGSPSPPGRSSINHGPRYPNNCGPPARLDYGHLGIRLIPMQAKASTPGHPTGRNDPTAGGVPRKLAGRSPGVAIRHPSGTLLCLHVSKPGSDGLELTPLLPLDATRSSPCRRLGYIVTKRLAMTAST